MMHLRCECGRTLGYELRHVGKKVRCPGCERHPTVPDSDQAPTPPDIPESPPVEQPAEVPRRDPPSNQEVPSPGLMRTAGEMLYSGPALTIMLVTAAIGGGLIVYAYSEGKVSSGATEVPRSVTCQRLIDGGIEDNPHVLVTDVLAGQNYFTSVRLTKEEKAAGNTGNKPWEVVYLPLLPLTPELKTRFARGEQAIPPPPAHLVRVILFSHKIKNKEQLGQIFTPEGAIQGMIVNPVSKLSGETENMLRQAYPGIDLTRVLLLEQGRTPMSEGLVTGLLIGGASLSGFAASLGLGALMYRPKRRSNHG